MPSSNIKRKKKPGLTNNGPSSNGGGGNYTETAMDEYLARLDLYRKPIAKDGSCLFRAVSEQVYNCQARHLQVRKDCIDFMRRNREKFEAFLEGPFDHHLFRLQNPKEWAGQVEISALSLMYKKDFIVYQAIDAEPTKVTDNNFKEKILLCFSNGNHYDAVYDIKFQKNAAVCQSLMYEILYQKVFTELDRKYNSKGPSQNKAGDVNSVMTNYYQNGLGEDDGFKDENEDNAGWTEVVRGRSNKAKSARQNRGYDQEEPKEEPMKPNLDQKHGWQAKRSLDNELYRNVELEVWEDSKNVQEQQDHSYAASIQYQPGDKCFAWLGQPDVADKVYEAIVKYYLPIQGNIEVKVPELGNKCFVIPLENLKPTENQQELNYRDLSGYYKKGEGPPGNNEGLRDDGKRGRRRNIPGRPGRGYKGDEQGEDTAARKGFQDESFGRPRGGGGPKFGGRGRGRGRYPRGGRDDRQMQREDEEARLIAEQAKLAELQGKDPAAFPALPTQQQQPEEKPPSTEAAPDQSPAEFWSRLKNTQGKPPVAPKENHVNTAENKPPSAPTSPTSQQAHTTKLDEKELETKKERPLTKEVRAPGAQNSEVVNKRAESKTLEAVNSVTLETSKREQNEPQKQALPLEKELSKPKVELSKGPNLNEIKQPGTIVPTLAEVKSVPPKSNVDEVKFADAVETRNAWAKEPTEKKELKTQDKIPDNIIKETVEPDLKKQEEPPSVKPQGVRGVIRMNNLNSKPQPATETAEQEESPKDIKLLRKEDPAKEIPNLKSALAGEGSSATPEKKTVTFAEPLKEGGEIKVLLSNAKDLAGKDGKREVIVPPTLVSVVMKPAPSSEIVQDKLTVMPTNKPEKNTNEENTTTAKNSTPNQDTNTKPQIPTTTPSDITATQGTEGAEPVPSTSPSVSQHQPMYQLPFLTVMYMQLPNLTSTPRMPQNMSMESDGSDLPEDPNTLRYFFNLGFQYHLHLSNQQWANQQMMYYPSVYQMPSQDHLQPHPAVSMGQQLNPGVPAQLIYQPQQMQAYHPAQIPPVMQENTSFSERNSVDRSSPGQTQQQQQQTQQQQQQQQQQPIPLHQTSPFVPNQHQPWRRSMAAYQGKQMHMGGYNNQVSNQQTPRGPMQQGAGNTKAHYKTKKYPKHRNDQFMYGSQAQHAQNQGASVHNAHAYSNTTQPAGSTSGAFYMTGGDHTAGKGSGDYYHSNQQYMNFHGNVPSSMTQAPHSAANSRGQYP